MSVHGEYSRSLEALLALVRQIDGDTAEKWAHSLECARMREGRDLTAAARSCLVVLEAIDTERNLSAPAKAGLDTDSLREPFQHLQAHCRAVLGISRQDGSDP